VFVVRLRALFVCLHALRLQFLEALASVADPVQPWPSCMADCPSKPADCAELGQFLGVDGCAIKCSPDDAAAAGEMLGGCKAAVATVSIVWAAVPNAVLSVEPSQALRVTELLGHNLIQLQSQAEFDGCELSLGTILSPNTPSISEPSTNTDFAFSAPSEDGTLFLVSGVGSDCEDGWKLVVNVRRSANAPTPTALPFPTSASSAPSIALPPSRQTLAPTAACLAAIPSTLVLGYIASSSVEQQAYESAIAEIHRGAALLGLVPRHRTVAAHR
jgi:hypothetical protein